MRELKPIVVEPDASPPRPGLHLVDLAGLVLGYALAGLFVRLYWPESRQVNFRVGVVVAVFYGWLGLAMSGPVLVLLRRLRPNLNEERNWPELAWIASGTYWLVLLLLARSSEGGAPIGPFVSGLPILVALILGLMIGGPSRPAGSRTPWTQRAAVGLLWTWPVAWICLILIGQTLM